MQIPPNSVKLLRQKALENRVEGLSRYVKLHRKTSELHRILYQKLCREIASKLRRNASKCVEIASKCVEKRRNCVKMRRKTP